MEALNLILLTDWRHVARTWHPVASAGAAAAGAPQLVVVPPCGAGNGIPPRRSRCFTPQGKHGHVKKLEHLHHSQADISMSCRWPVSLPELHCSLCS